MLCSIRSSDQGDSVTDPFVYQYSIGGLVFAVGWYFAGRQGYIGFSGRGVRNLIIMLGGLMFFMVLQGTSRDTRWWLGGLQSMHVVVGGLVEGPDDVVEIGPDTYELIVTARRTDKWLKVERLY